MAKMLNLEKLQHLKQLLQQAIAERDEYWPSEIVALHSRMEICAECKSTSFDSDSGCSCDNYD